MEYLRSSQSARIASWILREIVRSWVRNRFLASCWVRVEPPSTAPFPVASRRTAREMPSGSMPKCAVEALVLDRHEGLRQIGRQVDQPDRRAAGVAAVGDERAVVGEDGDVGRPLRHRELVDRRKLARVVGDEPAECDERPRRRGRRSSREAPAAGSGAAFAGFCRRAWPWRRPCGGREGGRSAGSARRSSSPPRPLRHSRRGSIRVRFFLPPRPNMTVPLDTPARRRAQYSGSASRREKV